MPGIAFSIHLGWLKLGVGISAVVITILAIIMIFKNRELLKDIFTQSKGRFNEVSTYVKCCFVMLGAQVLFLILNYLIVMIAAGLGFSFIGILAQLAFSGVYQYGVINVMNLIKRQEPFTLSNFFDTSDLGRVMGLVFIKSIYQFLWTLLLIVPGVIKYYEYSQAFFILFESSGETADEAITYSRELMQGKKLKLFALQACFFVFLVLAPMSFGLSLILVAPFYYMSRYCFYEYTRYGHIRSTAPRQVIRIYR